MACYYVNDKLYIKKVVAVRMEFPQLIKEIERFAYENSYTEQSRIYIEPKASGKSIVQQLQNTTKLNVIESQSPSDSKVSRVSSVSAVIEAGRVILIDGSYIDSFLGECIAFPNGVHDDMVDVLTSALLQYTSQPAFYFG
jgi:predicted phage terminase large subunit-like protein